MYVSETLQQNDNAVAPVAAKGGNGFAVTSLITGILTLWPFALVFGILGVRRAKKVGKGAAMAWIGIVLAVLALGGYAYVTPHLTKLLDPGCQAAIKVHNNYPDSKIAADASNPQAFAADVEAEIAGFTDAANKSKNATAKAAMQAQVVDLTQLLQAAGAGQPTDAIAAKSTADEDTLTKACGGF
jgi:hypothetical protein